MNNNEEDFKMVNKDTIKMENQLKNIMQEALKSCMQLKQIDFQINKSFNGNGTAAFSLVKDIKYGSLIFNRTTQIINFKKLSYTTCISYVTQDNATFLGESKVATIWTRDPDTIMVPKNIFSTMNVNGQVMQNLPTSFLNTSLQKDVLVIRNKYVSCFITNKLITASSGDTQTIKFNNTIYFDRDGEKSNYYGKVKSTSYDEQTGLITQGNLAILMMSGKKATVSQTITITGRLEYY